MSITSSKRPVTPPTDGVTTKPVVPTIVSTQVLALSALLPNSSPTSYKANSVGSPSTKRSVSPTGQGALPQKLPRLPQRPTTSEGQLSKTMTQFSSVGDVRSGHTNQDNSATDFVSQGVDKQSSTTRPSASLNQRNQRPTGQDSSILSNPLTSSPASTVPPLCDQRTSSLVVDSTTSSSQLPSEDLMDAPNGDADKKPVHWPKQAPTVHWITSEDSYSTRNGTTALTSNSSTP